MTDLLTVEGLSKSFDVHGLGDARVVGIDDVSFAVREGEFLAVVGESGSGKSSLLKCLYRTYEPDEGSAYYHPAETDLATCDGRTVLGLRNDALGYTSQFLTEIPRVPAVDVVSRPFRERGEPTEASRDRARELLDALRLPRELWDAYPATFSGGERQRVNLAQAVAPEPDLLLLDEPTSALDPETRRAAIDLLGDAAAEDTSMIGVFHDRDVVADVADRVLVLEDGACRPVVPIEEFDAEVAV